ncbi:hypothetical protein OLM81_16355 [Pseudomonas aeruginosa]|uniref:hypothetical protein n=1 Tax=Pseudomonas aeruginosa TaxID=287 RepID=UPI001CBEF90B|nr:hypothetical protein [Pseudomonas aeruginosa]MBX5597391.1 hypothetical protein [Pseudomonas aeruginosa]MDI2376522.1 hypothetical protein [Pseudomonas aeruginosa]MDI2382275.1 hypothetical protein [Pseudomonas aeruginosa]
METKDVLALLSCLLLIASGTTYGVKFLRKRNYLLGFECLIVAFSATNFLIYLLTELKVPYSISFFLDAFSRGFGIPIVAVLGMMAVTHDYKPSGLKDALIFAVTFAATFVLIKADFMAGPLPYFYVFMWGVYSLYLIYFIARLASLGERLHALGMAVAAVLGMAVACIYDFFPIPGDESKVVFLTIALASWAYMMAQMYYAYFAFERAKGRIPNAR